MLSGMPETAETKKDKAVSMAELVLWPLVAIGSAGALVQLSVRVIGAHLGSRWTESGEQSVGGL